MLKKIYALLALSGALLISGAAWSQQADNANPEVVMHTSLGTITLELYADKAPKSTENFLQYVRDGFYENTVFHRVISYFMIQGGGFDANMMQKATREPIENEADNGLKNERGTVAMARTMNPHSATSQFFINVQDNPPLDHRGKESSREWGYAVFGKVTAGMDVVDEIRFAETGARPPHWDVPLNPITIERIEIVD